MAEQVSTARQLDSSHAVAVGDSDHALSRVCVVKRLRAQITVCHCRHLILLDVWCTTRNIADNLPSASSCIMMVVAMKSLGVMGRLLEMRKSPTEYLPPVHLDLVHGETAVWTRVRRRAELKKTVTLRDGR